LEGIVPTKPREVPSLSGGKLNKASDRRVLFISSSSRLYASSILAVDHRRFPHTQQHRCAKTQKIDLISMTSGGNLFTNSKLILLERSMREEKKSSGQLFQKEDHAVDQSWPGPSHRVNLRQDNRQLLMWTHQPPPGLQPALHDQTIE
jgi:hypothetical protein